MAMLLLVHSFHESLTMEVAFCLDREHHLPRR